MDTKVAAQIRNSSSSFRAQIKSFYEGTKMIIISKKSFCFVYISNLSSFQHSH